MWASFELAFSHSCGKNTGQLTRSMKLQRASLHYNNLQVIWWWWLQDVSYMTQEVFQGPTWQLYRSVFTALCWELAWSSYGAHAINFFSHVFVMSFELGCWTEPSLTINSVYEHWVCEDVHKWMAVKLQPYKLQLALEAWSLSRLDNPVLTL
jgi:hypothetical protein